MILRGDILGPACDEDDISKELKSYNFKVTSQDLYDRGYGNIGGDFLKETRNFDNIITSPPFSLANEFIKNALKIASKDVAILIPITYLNTIKRNELFSEFSPLKIIFLKNRVDFQNKDVLDILCSFVWVVWSKDKVEYPFFIWIGKNEVLNEIKS